MVTYVLRIPVHIRESRITDNGCQQHIIAATTWTTDKPDPHSSFGKIVYLGWGLYSLSLPFQVCAPFIFYLEHKLNNSVQS